MASEPQITFRSAERRDLASIVALLADDQLGAGREIASETLNSKYLSAFEEIQADANNELVVAEQCDVVVGTLQITYAPNLTHLGSMRATIEGVRVSTAFRSSGIGSRMLRWTIERCRKRGCAIVQLTSDLARDDAIAFYGSLGFKHTHAGLKLRL